MTIQTDRGAWGEQAAETYLAGRGWRVLARRWRPAPPLRGDIDLIAQQGETVVFIEVRTRAAGHEMAYASVGQRKRDQMVKLAYAYLDTTPALVWRIDIIAVSVGRGSTPLIDHTEDALDW